VSFPVIMINLFPALWFN